MIHGHKTGRQAEGHLDDYSYAQGTTNHPRFSNAPRLVVKEHLDTALPVPYLIGGR